MKKIATILIILISSNVFSQTEYYSTDGINRISESELNEMLNGIAKKATKVLKKKMSSIKVIEETTQINDSIIHRISFHLFALKTKQENKEKIYSQLENKRFPEFQLMSLKDNEFSSLDLKGKPTLINFWFTKCAPCIDEMPILNEIYEKYKDKMNFISITYESKEKVKEFLKKHSYNFNHLIDSNELIEELEISSYPKNIFIDKNGIVKKIEGGIPYKQDDSGKLKILTGEKFENIIKSMI